MSLIFQCPHCNEHFLVSPDDVKCGIFRHSMFKDGKFVNPHATKEELDNLQSKDLVFGCCKPLRITISDGIVVVEKCGYI